MYLKSFTLWFRDKTFQKKMNMMKYEICSLNTSQKKNKEELCPSSWLIKEIMGIIEPEYAKQNKKKTRSIDSD